MGSTYNLSWYINPHLFWLRSTDSWQNTEFMNLEHALDKYYKLHCSLKTDDYMPHVNEVRKTF